MTRMNRTSAVALSMFDGHVAARASNYQGYAETRKPVGKAAGTYDALDYRLMDTFPASDATAQY